VSQSEPAKILGENGIIGRKTLKENGLPMAPRRGSRCKGGKKEDSEKGEILNLFALAIEMNGGEKRVPS